MEQNWCHNETFDFLNLFSQLSFTFVHFTLKYANLTSQILSYELCFVDYSNYYETLELQTTYFHNNKL